MTYKFDIKYFSLIVGIFALIFCINLTKKEELGNEAEIKCFSESDTMTITFCLEEILIYWKSEMNQQLNMVDDDTKVVQQLWVAYKNKQINIINKQYSGSGTATIYLRLVPIIQIYKHRAQELKLNSAYW